MPWLEGLGCLYPQLRVRGTLEQDPAVRPFRRYRGAVHSLKAAASTVALVAGSVVVEIGCVRPLRDRNRHTLVVPRSLLGKGGIREGGAHPQEANSSLRKEHS
jgi:hypothetical protein